MIPALPDQPSFSMAEVAELTGFSKRSLEAACRDGRITHQHLGRQRTLTRDQLIELFRTTHRPAQAKPDPAPTGDQRRIDQTRNRVLGRLERKAQAA